MLQSFEDDGVVVARGLVTGATLDGLLEAWRKFAPHVHRRKVAWNRVDISHLGVPQRIQVVHALPEILDFVETALGPDIALYNQRLVVKDDLSSGPVMLHQDTPYHAGYQRKASLFLALSEVSWRNGAMRFYKGTHKFGNLGDAGEIDSSMLGSRQYFSPELEPGDAVLMHSATWHDSVDRQRGTPDRVLVDIIYQPTDDPTGTALLRGVWKRSVRLDRTRKIFAWSRSSRLAEFAKQVESLKST